MNKFLEFNEYQILEGFGNITREKAIQKASEEYDQFNKLQKLDSDFDQSIKSLKKIPNS